MMVGEIIFGVSVAGYVLYIFGREIYKRIQGIPSGECQSCSNKKVSWLKDYRKTYQK